MVAVTEQVNLRQWLPPIRQPVVVADGKGGMVMDATWYRFFDHVANVRLGGADAPSVPDLVASAIETQATVATTSASLATVATQTQTNAEVLAVVSEVASVNALTGADQIPPVSLQ